MWEQMRLDMDDPLSDRARWPARRSRGRRDRARVRASWHHAQARSVPSRTQSGHTRCTWAQTSTYTRGERAMVSVAVVREQVARPISVPFEVPYKVIDRNEL